MQPRRPTRTPTGGRGARERIITAAVALFGRQGINATGVAELAQAAKVSKRTLYKHFPHKDDVVMAYLRELEDHPELTAEGALGREALTPRARLLELFAALGEQPLAGCPFLSVAVEQPDPRTDVRRLAAEHKQRFAEQLTALAREAGARPAELVGARLALLYDGAAAGGAALGSPAPARAAFALAAALLDAAIA